eukprot:881917-Rhodomonas_salina.1
MLQLLAAVRHTGAEAIVLREDLDPLLPLHPVPGKKGLDMSTAARGELMFPHALRDTIQRTSCLLGGLPQAPIFRACKPLTVERCWDS